MIRGGGGCGYRWNPVAMQVEWWRDCGRHTRSRSIAGTDTTATAIPGIPDRPVSVEWEGGGGAGRDDDRAGARASGRDRGRGSSS